MKLHESKQDFKDAIEATAQHLNIRPVFIEKDYWVTHVLKNLSKSKYVDTVVFKGGTSLSKAYACIERFSEDIDLAILAKENYTGNQLKTLLKKVTQDISAGLKDIPGHALEKKMGEIRATVHEYDKVVDSNDFGVVKDHILIEINCFADPVPHNNLPIQSYITQYLAATNEQSLIEEYNMQPFNINVLSMERTFFEKVLALNRLSYDGTEKLIEKVRHFYDIYQLFAHPDLKNTLLTPDNFNIVASVIKDDEAIGVMKGEWIGKPIANSPLFKNLEEVWSTVAPAYQAGLADLIWTKEMPSALSVLDAMQNIKAFIREFDGNWSKLDR